MPNPMTRERLQKLIAGQSVFVVASAAFIYFLGKYVRDENLRVGISLNAILHSPIPLSLHSPLVTFTISVHSSPSTLHPSPSLFPALSSP